MPWQILCAFAGRISDAAEERAVSSLALDKPSVVAYGAGRECSAAAAEKAVWIGYALHGQAVATDAAGFERLAAKMTMLAGEIRAAAFGLREHTAAAGVAPPLRNAGLADFDGLVVGAFDQFPGEG